MIYTTEPPGFQKKFDIVSCFCEREGKLLVLHRHDQKPQGDLWGFPAGKVAPGESLPEAMQRELLEETGLSVPTTQLTFLHTVYDRYPGYDFLFHMFQTTIATEQIVRINPAEHTASQWLAPKEILTLPIMEDLDTVMNMFYSAGE